MAEVYCDYTNGDDGTGDGSAGNPYKTITQATLGLTGGDEVRVAKSPAESNQSGTSTFTEISTAVLGSGTAYSTEFAVADYIKGGTGLWWEILTITDDTHLTLYQGYSETTESGVAAVKLGVTDTGAAAASTTAIQTVSVSGTSRDSRLKISGGWDLTGPTQDGQTYFRQKHGTIANRWGYGLFLNSKSSIEVERLGFLRYYNGIRNYRSPKNLYTAPMCLGCGQYGMLVSSRIYDVTITSPIICQNFIANLYMDTTGVTITDGIFNSSDGKGIIMLGAAGMRLYNTTIKHNDLYAIEISSGYGLNIIEGLTTKGGTRGIYCLNSPLNVINNWTMADHTDGFYGGYGGGNVINGFYATGNTTDVVIAATGTYSNLYSEEPNVGIQHFKASGDNRCYYEYGVTYRDTTDARSTQCLKFDPKSALYYISQSFNFIAESGVAQTLSVYIKDDATFNGDIQACIYFLGERITGWTEWTPTTSYVQQSIVAGAGDISEDGVLELRIKVRGTAGNVFVDDLSTA